MSDIKQELYEGMQVSLFPAPVFRRILAYSIDVGIITTLLYFLGTALFVVFGVSAALFLSPNEADLLFRATKSEEKALSAGIIIAMALVILLFLFFYHAYFVYSEYRYGKTIGKKAFGLSVVSLDGKKLSLGQCILRDVLRYIDCSLILPGAIAIALSKRSQRIGDMAAGTLVVFSKAESEKVYFTYLKQSDYNYAKKILSVQPLDRKQKEDFLFYAFQTYIKGNSLSEEKQAYYKDFCNRMVSTIDQSVQPSLKDKELFLAEFCNQTINEKGD